MWLIFVKLFNLQAKIAYFLVKIDPKTARDMSRSSIFKVNQDTPEVHPWYKLGPNANNICWVITFTHKLCPFSCWLVCRSLTSLCHSNGHIETMPAREFNPFTALTRIRSQFLRTQWSTSNHQRVDMTTPHTAQPSGLAPFSC